MELILDNFNGIAPVLDAKRLGTDMAQVAENCYFRAKSLRALKAPLAIDGMTVPNDAVTVFPYAGSILSFSSLHHVVASPVHNDTFDRVFYTGGSYPVVRSGAAEYRLGIPRPSAAPVATATEVPDEEDADELLDGETIYYVFTYVDGFGAEGPHSLPTSGTECVRNTDVNLTFPAVPTGNYNFGAAARIRLYRSNTGTEDTDFQYVTDLPIATASWTDNVDNELLQEVVPSATWIGPPDDDNTLWPQGPLQGLCGGKDGVLAGYVGRTVHFCEPYLPHAWPLAYRITSDHDIVAITSVSSGWLVVTTGRPFLIVGTDPASYTQQSLEGEGDLPCISARSLVNMGDYALYSSSAGLVAVSGMQATLVTSDLLDKDTWAQFAPATLIGGAHMDQYVGFYDTGEAQGAIIFDPAGGKASFSTATVYADAVFYNNGDASLYVKQGTSICIWNGGASLDYTWRSKEFMLPADATFTYLEVIGSYADVSIEIIADDTTVFSGAVTTRYSVLPAHKPALSMQVEITGSSDLLLVGLHELLTPGG